MAEVQKKYQKANQHNLNMRKKIELLKEPLKKYMKKAPQPEDAEEAFKSIWDKLEARQKMMAEASKEARVQFGEGADRVLAEGNGKWSMKYSKDSNSTKSTSLFRWREKKTQTKKRRPSP